MGDGRQWTFKDPSLTRVPQRNWWSRQTKNVYDRATAMLPALFYERLDSIGIDHFSSLPNLVLTFCAAGR